ncbi:MAG TPA: DoxX family protein [Bryobacteraceae bacterium]|nr:DoxX family protein [Bryobacteraceae bacterium]
MNSALLSAIRIATGLLFFQHGAEKLWGFAGGQIDHNYLTLHGFAGPLEVIGGTLITFGLFTRFAAFILCGQMAVAYFDQWAGRGFFPISNGGEEAVIFCFVYLWLVAAGPGPWSVDRRIGWDAKLGRALDPWEPSARSIARVILAFLYCLHGLRHAFGLLAKSAGRAAVIPLAIDRLPAWVGWVEIVCGVLLLAGLFTQISAAVVCVEMAAAYVMSAMPRGAWPIHNGGNEVLMYLVFFVFLAACGAGSLSIDAWLERKREPRAYTASAAHGY